MAKLDISQLYKEIGLREVEILKFAKTTLKDHVEQSRKVAEQQFDNHPVTKEIEAGPEASNSSGLLGGVRGNLFSFIGFVAGTKPTMPLKELFKRAAEVSKPQKKIKKNSIDYFFRVRIASFADFEKLAPAPFGLGFSWIRGIEFTGISGLGSYIFRNTLNRSVRSRSGTGIQSENIIRGAIFTTTPYVSAILTQMNKNIESIK